MAHDSDKAGGEISGGGRVIDLQGHHAASQIVDDLLRADRRSPNYHRLSARAIALGPPVLAAIVRRLDVSRPVQLAALGRLAATYPDRSEVIAALQRAAADRRSSDSRRLGAMLLLAQHLGVPPEPDFLAGLRNPPLAIAMALVGAFNDGARDPDMLRDYVTALLSQPVDALCSVVAALAEVPGDGAVAALRVLALQPDAELMQASIEALAARSSVASIRALATLEPNLPPDMARSVSRLLQKLKLSGYGLEPLTRTDQRCRAQLTPVDGHGRRMLWLRAPVNGRSGDIVALGLLLNELLGVSSAFLGASAVADSRELFPIGTLYAPPAERASSFTPLVMTTALEVPYLYALRVLREAVAINWDSGHMLPLDYQLSFHAVWAYAAGLSAETALTEDVDSLAGPGVPDGDMVLSDPLFDSWYLESGTIYVTAQELVSEEIELPDSLDDQEWRTLLPVVLRLARSEFGPELRRSYADRLRKMSEWLAIAGRPEEAIGAARSAETMLVSPPETNPTVIALVQKGILVALENIRSAPAVEI